MPDEEERFSIVAREAYLVALQRHWPEVLASLRRDVLPVYQPILYEYQDEDGDTVATPIFERWERTLTRPECQGLLAALANWARQFRISEPWIFEAALDALLRFHKFGSELREGWIWSRHSRDSHARFEPKFTQNYWYGTQAWEESWDKFRDRMEGEFGDQLSAYRRAVELKFAVGKQDYLIRDAELMG